MPTLDWLNREDAFRIAARVPTRVLLPHAAALSSVGDAAAARDKLLVQGDNHEALEALLPFYRGRVKCIFIDPSYITKSAFEHYATCPRRSRRVKSASSGRSALRGSACLRWCLSSSAG